ncbi:hypothetical protein NE236_19000 [Actinoallomurus purpureus]|uniref:hypothetical protein n=1 Tax=Actinoallomurus purpureus TaxID=478114 RepID=UPI0020929982|nr:hypothetical protein [Actinoallomurus purpureus]MCO6007074.1 hypothetical protein [Actinoallomurus purpureus]
MHAAIEDGEEDAIPAALALLWADQYLDTLWRLEAHLGRHAAQSSPRTASPQVIPASA